MNPSINDTETTCHCGAKYNGSDHCPACYCEQYESQVCPHATRKDILKAKRSKWTKKDYEMVAAIVASHECVNINEGWSTKQYCERQEKKKLAHAFADTFANDSPLFDRERFLRACGVTQ
jgi:hypothetical protein